MAGQACGDALVGERLWLLISQRAGVGDDRLEAKAALPRPATGMTSTCRKPASTSCMAQVGASCLGRRL